MTPAVVHNHDRLLRHGFRLEYTTLGCSPLGIVWTAVSAAVMFALARGKAVAGEALDNLVLETEGRVTFIDGLLASSVLLGLVLNSAFGLLWADPVAGFVIVFYGLKEARTIFASLKTKRLV